MQNGPKTFARARQPRPGASFAVRSKRRAARLEPESSQNAQRNYERYLALARAEAAIGNTVGAENYYQHAEHYFRSIFLNLEATTITFAWPRRRGDRISLLFAEAQRSRRDFKVWRSA
jgi:hypothetical protein